MNLKHRSAEVGGGGGEEKGERAAEVNGMSMPCFIAIHSWNKGDALITPVITFLTHAYLQLVDGKHGVGEHLSGRRSRRRPIK